MKLYMTIAEVFEHESLLHRAELADKSKVEPAIAYLFLACYAEATVKSIVEGAGRGESFLTFIPPKTHLITQQLAAMWGRDKVVPLLSWDISSEVERDIRFYDILSLVERTWSLAGLTPKEGAEKTKVSLLMNEIGNAMVCVEC